MKRFTIKFLAFFAVGYIFVLSYLFLFRPMMTGDIGKLGKVMFRENPNIVNTVPKNQVHNVAITDNTVLSTNIIYTIGDSFSNIKERYSQYLGSNSNKEIHNIQTSISPIQEFVNLIQHGQIPQNTYVIVESVERYLASRLANLNFSDTTVSVEDVYMPPQPVVEKKKFFKIPKVKHISAWIRIGLFNMDNPIEVFELSQECFSHSGFENDLYVYYQDFGYQQKPTRVYEQAVHNMKHLKHIADSAGVNMIFLVAADKYDVYTPYIVDNAYPQNPTMNYFADLDTTWFVDTKRLLQPYIEAGVKDVYYVNDTHWSPIGAKIVGEHIAAMLVNDLDSLGIIR